MQSLVIEPRSRTTQNGKVLRVASIVFGAAGLMVLSVFYPEADGDTVTTFLIVSLGAPVMVWILTYLDGQQSVSPLEIDGQGFTCPAYGATEMRRWTWREVSAFQLIERPDDPYPNASFIRFQAPVDLRVPTRWQDAAPIETEAAEVRIYDRYDPSLRQTADDLNAARARAVGLSSAGAADATPLGANRRTVYPEPVAFLADHERQWSQLALLLLGGFFPCLLLDDLTRLFWILTAMLFMGVIVVALVDHFVFPRRRRERQVVALDGRGLTCSFAGREQRWDWKEIGACRFAGSSGRWRHIVGHYLVIEVARATEAPRLVNRLLRRLFHRQVVVLADIYLVSLEEVAAKIEAYRDSAQEREA